MNKREDNPLFLMGMHMPATEQSKQNQRQEKSNSPAVISRDKKAMPVNLYHEQPENKTKCPEEQGKSPEPYMALPSKQYFLLQVEPSETGGSKQQNIQGQQGGDNLKDRMNTEHKFKYHRLESPKSYLNS